MSILILLQQEMLEVSGNELCKAVTRGDVVDVVEVAQLLNAKAIYFLLGLSLPEEVELRAKRVVFDLGREVLSRVGISQSQRSPRRVLIMTYNILRSKSYYSHPNDFDVRRKQLHDAVHFWFGTGSHACLGGDLARREIQTVLAGLIAPGKEVNILSRGYRSRGLLPGYSTLKVRARM